jgi:hypothetical protein
VNLNNTNVPELWSEQTATDLEAAADYIDDHGWTQGMLENQDGQVCLRGAIAHICQHNSSLYVSEMKILNRQELNAVVAVQNYLDTGLNPYRSTATNWNDQRGRTADDVTAALRKAAVYVREQM